MPEPPFKRPPGWRFVNRGTNLRDVPDALDPNQYAALKNMRSTGSSALRVRPGYEPIFNDGNNNNGTRITDIAGYATLGTDTFPRLLARDSNGSIWLDTGVNVGNLNGNAGFGASMLPFRPAESPQSWMYIGALGDYRKISAPDANNNVINYKVGIAEPQNAVDAAPQVFGFSLFANNSWTNNGTAGGVSAANRSSDTTDFVVADPLIATRWYCQVGNNANASYAIGELVQMGNNNLNVIIQDVLPPISGNLLIQSIRYDAGNNGLCTITPTQSAGTQTGLGSDALSQLRHGSLVRLGGNETVLVREVIIGPGGALCFRASTAGTFVANNTIAGLPAIVVDQSGIAAGMSVVATYSQSNFTAGLAQLTQALPAGTFGALFASGNNNIAMQPEDYIHFSLAFSDPTQLNSLMVFFNLDGNANNYGGDLLYYSVRPGDLVAVPSSNTNQLAVIAGAAQNLIIDDLPTPEDLAAPFQSVAGNNQFAEVMFPVSALTRIGNDRTRTLTNCTGIRIQVSANNNVSMRWSSAFTRFGGGMPDVGNNGEFYRYMAVPLDSVTGTRGNPTPMCYYGVNPRRQTVLLNTANLNSSFGGNYDTWEIYRYGGSITSYRFIGTTPVGNNFVDNVSDGGAIGGGPLTIDNTEPWPSIDYPWKVTSGNGTIRAFGNVLDIAANNGFTASVARWLPGTLFQVGNNNAYTLRLRPVASGNNYIFTFEECIGSGNQTSVFVLEPNVARQTLPYLWGPDAQGFFFGCGDPLRPGTLSYSKGYTPDAVPTSHNTDLCPPSEPLLGGRTIRGISLAASSFRWWAMYFQPGGTPLFSPVEVPVGKRLVSPFGMDSDGLAIYFWSGDGIYMTDGGPAKSLTDKDLYNLFPHGGTSGITVVREVNDNGTLRQVAFYAPDYAHSAQFRIAVRDGILYADYPDCNGVPRTLICELEHVAWGTDIYHDPVTVHYGIQQPKGALTSSNNNSYPNVVMGDNNGRVWRMKDLHNDNNNTIPWVVATFQWTGGDLRTNELYGDAYIDMYARNNVVVVPMSQSASVANNTVVAANNNRQFQVVNLGGGVLSSFFGLWIEGDDNFS